MGWNLKVYVPGGGGGAPIPPTPLTVGEIDGSPTCNNVTRLLFNGVDERVTCGAPGTALINAATPPPLLGGPFTMAGTTLYTGRESRSNTNYEGGTGDAFSGQQHDYLTENGILTLTEPSFGYGSLGIVTMSLNGVVVAQIDLGLNFVEANRAAGQNIAADYNTGSGGFTLVGGVCAFQGAYAGMGNMRVVFVQPYGGITADRYQEAQIIITITSQNFWRQGYNYVDLGQVGAFPESPLAEDRFKIFHDKDAGPDPSVAAVDLTIGVPVLKYLSGVRYYGSGSTFGLSMVGSDCFDNVYHFSNAPIVFDDAPLWNWGIALTPILYTDPTVTGVSTPPNIGNTMTVTNFMVTVPANQDEDDARLRVTPRDPYGNYTAVDTPSHLYMIMSWGNVSTRVREYFRDEQYRFPTNTDFNVVPGAATGNWTSSNSLAAGTPGYTSSLQVYDPDAATNPNRLIHPHVDYTGRLPAGSPDYTPLAAGVNYEYYRIFHGIIDHSNGIIAVPGLTNADFIGALPNVKMYIKVPTKTMWLDVWVDYNAGTFNANALYPTGVDGEGCRINKLVHSPDLDGTIEFTLGPYASDAGVSRYLYVKIVYKDNTIPRFLNGSGSGFGLTNW